MGKIRTLTTDKAFELHDKLQGEAQVKFIQHVMKEEEVDWDMAYAICIGRCEPREPEYTLGYKLSDPMMLLAMFKQPGRKARAQAVANFEEGLEPDELELFRSEVLNTSTRGQLKAALHRKKKDP